MGTWGVGIYADDLAADLRADFRDLIGEGLSATAAVDRLLGEYASSLNDPEEGPVFWLALADSQWKLGRLEDRTVRHALRGIDTGQDLRRWDAPKDRDRREGVLRKLRAQLLSPPPEPKRVPRFVREANDWAVGEIIGLQLASQQWTLMRVIGHHTDKGGRFAVCEFLDWCGESLPEPKQILRLSVRRDAAVGRPSQFVFQKPRSKKEEARIVRTGLHSRPAQQPGGYGAVMWAMLDRI